MKINSSTIKSLSIAASILLANTIAWAQTQEVATKATTSVPFELDTILLFLGLFVLVVVVLGLSYSARVLTKSLSDKSKKTLSLIALLLLSSAAFAQTESVAPIVPSSMQRLLFNPETYVIGFAFFILIIAVYVLYRANMTYINMISGPVDANATVAVAEEKAPGFFRKIYLRMVDSVPVSKEKDIVLDHDYDGIKELDNNLPPWWKYGFYLTIVFSFLYMFVYHVTGTGKLQLAEYNDELHAAQLAKAERMKSSAENITEDNVVALKETDVLAKGKDSYDKLCAACHRADGGGQVGPNLTDEFWLHGGGIKNIFHTITYGVPDKGMISWQSQLSPKQIQYVASYLMTMQGTKPAGPKEPQGEKWTEVAATTADSTTTATADSLSK